MLRRYEAFHQHAFGKTPKARATIQVLGINDAEAVALRESLLEEGVRFE